MLLVSGQSRQMQRTGSALLLCVVLLLLLGTLAILMLTASRSDRAASIQHVNNTQLDLLMQGIRESVLAEISNDVLDTATRNYRRIETYAGDEQRWLASRYPTVVDPFAVSSEFVWQHVSATGLASTSGGKTAFESPYVDASKPTVVSALSETSKCTPSSLAITQADGSIQSFPSLTFDIGSERQSILAADADGDGVADSGLCHIASFDRNGISYYVGIRIIDNNAAVNVNTAWDRSFDYAPRNGAAWQNGDSPTTAADNPLLAAAAGNVRNSAGFYRTNVDLIGLLYSFSPATHVSQEMTQLNAYRFGGEATLSAASNGQILYDYYDGSDALETNLARVLERPGLNDHSRFRSLSISEEGNLASHFCIDRHPVTNSVLGSVLAPSISAGVNPLIRSTPYPLTEAARTSWYQNNFNWNAGRRPLRSALVSRNGTSNLITPVVCTGADGKTGPLIPPGTDSRFAYMTAYSQAQNHVIAVKTDANTASFSELWRAFWSVFASEKDPTQPPFPASAGEDAKMFRSPIRNLHNDAPVLTPTMMLQLRSAIAAVNTIDLRDSDDDITSVETQLYDVSPSTANAPITLIPKYRVRVFGTEKQPFITEVYANTFSGPFDGSNAGVSALRNPKGYIAIELYNPYNSPLMLRHWALALIDRRYTSANASLKLIALSNDHPFLNNGELVIPPKTHVVLENYPSNGAGTDPATDAQYRPQPLSTLPPNVIAVYVPRLSSAIEDVASTGGEVDLLRPHRAVVEGAPLNLTASITSGNIYDEGDESNLRLSDFVPVDSFDFTGIRQSPAVDPSQAAQGTILHYVRENGDSDSHAWKFVYPGLILPRKYDPSQMFSRHSGVFLTHFASTTYTDASPTLMEPTDCNFGTYDDHCSEFAATGKRVAPWPGVQLVNDDMAGFNKGVKCFPFGAFARNGDLLQIPFIGGYQIRALDVSDSSILEMNPVTIDCSFVDDQARDPQTNLRVADPIGTSDNSYEQLGRFCPIYTAAATPAVDDLDPAGGYAAAIDQSNWRYHFATKLFDYLTVQSPATDREPNVDPAADKLLAFGIVSTPPPVTNGLDEAGDPVAKPGSTHEYTVGVDGLININTAPWWIIGALPLLPNDLAGPRDNMDANNNGIPDFNEMLAKQIVAWRDGDGVNPGHGPFRSIFDLERVEAADPKDAVVPQGFPAASLPDSLRHRVPAFADAIRFYSSHLRSGYTDPDPTDGDVAPNVPGAGDGVHEPDKPDFEERFLMLNRLSNLITTRSDTFTVYIDLQGWRDAGTSHPTLAIERRATLIIDRNPVTGAVGSTPRVMVVPVN